MVHVVIMLQSIKKSEHHRVKFKNINSRKETEPKLNPRSKVQEPSIINVHGGVEGSIWEKKSYIT